MFGSRCEWEEAPSKSRAVVPVVYLWNSLINLGQQNYVVGIMRPGGPPAVVVKVEAKSGGGAPAGAAEKAAVVTFCCLSLPPKV